MGRAEPRSTPLVSLPPPTPPKPKTAKKPEEKEFLVRLKGDDWKMFEALREHYANDKQSDVVRICVRTTYGVLLEQKAAAKKSSK